MSYQKDRACPVVDLTANPSTWDKRVNSATLTFADPNNPTEPELTQAVLDFTAQNADRCAELTDNDGVTVAYWDGEEIADACCCCPKHIEYVENGDGTIDFVAMNPTPVGFTPPANPVVSGASVPATLANFDAFYTGVFPTSEFRCCGDMLADGSGPDDVTHVVEQFGVVPYGQGVVYQSYIEEYAHFVQRVTNAQWPAYQANLSWGDSSGAAFPGNATGSYPTVSYTNNFDVTVFARLFGIFEASFDTNGTPNLGGVGGSFFYEGVAALIPSVNDVFGQMAYSGYRSWTGALETLRTLHGLNSHDVLSQSIIKLAPGASVTWTPKAQYKKADNSQGDAETIHMLAWGWRWLALAVQARDPASTL